MKKILIASACAFALCLTSCASKKAPETENQAEVPQTEAENTAEVTEENTTEEQGSVSASENADEEETSAEEKEEAAPAQDEESALSSEAFPEPEAIEEEEIITLEPPEEAEAPANETASEEVEKEEPPEITIINQEAEETAQQNEAADSENNEAENSEDLITDSASDTDFISGGIDITDDDSDSGEEYIESEKDISPSRSVTLKKFEYLDVTYPGSGWIYMGLTDNSKDLAYFGRKLGTKDTKFSLQARAAGTKIIHFYRNDPLTGQYLDDYIEVIITSENGSNKTHIEAPEFKLPVQKKEKPAAKTEAKSEQESEDDTKNTASQAKPVTAETKASTVTEKKALPSENQTEKAAAATAKAETSASTEVSTKTESDRESSTSEAVSAATAEADSPSNPDALLQEAQILYNEKEYSTALNKLNQFFEYSTDNRDQALYLKGQILEAKSDVRDIKGAIDAYTTLTKNYPASKLWDSANKRIIYLKRFYLEVR